MLTRCPQCVAWFRVRAEQLSVANGLVTCGRCEQVFNALASLIEEAAVVSSPLPPRVEDLTTDRAAQTTDQAPAVPDAPAVLASRHHDDGLEARHGAEATALNTDDVLPQVDAHAAEIDVPRVPLPADSLDIGPLSRQLHELDIADFDFSADDQEVHDAPAAQHSGARARTEAPAVLLDDLAALESAPRPAVWRSVAWTLFGLVLLALAAAQLAFIERQPLLARVPDAALLIDALCARLPCLERREAASKVRLLARDVREHPSYRDALLVNASIVNDANTPSPYPVIDLRLRDAVGNVLSARQFQPSEYLDQSIDIAAGMPAARPVYIVLELAGNASNAVSFEFTFM